MKKVLTVALWSFFAGYVTTFGLSYVIDVVQIYQTTAQGHLFSGLLALAAFLLTLKTFVIVKFYEGIYQSPKYQEYYVVANMYREEAEKSVRGLLEPLKELTNFLVWTVGAALVASLAQISLGYWKDPIATGICVGLAVMTLTLLCWIWGLIRQNLKKYFSVLEDENAPRLAEIEARIRAEEKAPKAPGE